MKYETTLSCHFEKGLPGMIPENIYEKGRDLGDSELP